MRQKLFQKYFLAASLMVLFSLTVMMMILTFVYNSYLSKSKYESLNKACVSVAEFAAENGDSLDAISENHIVYDVAANIAEVSDLDIYITDSSGQIRICGCPEWNNNGKCDHSGTLLNSPLFDDLKDASHGLDSLGIYKEQHYVSVTKLYFSGKFAGFVVSTSPIAANRALLLRVGKLYLWSAVIPIVLLFFALYALTYRMTKPLKLMSEAAKAMAKGDFSKRIPVTSDDEIGELAVSFNQMTNSLARLEEMRKGFVANVSHEMKTPMTTIAGFIDGMIDGTIEPEKHNYYLGIVSEEVKRLSRMVQSMLELSRLESGEFVLKPERFDFRELLLQVVIGQEQRIEQKQISIGGLEKVPNVTVFADKDLIYRVIYNLVDNAIKFTDESGIIDFSLHVDAKNLVFKIKNTGRGIPASELPYVFERFYKVDKSRSANKNSTGLGLYIVKTIIKNHGGTITVTGKENEFTVFVVTLPLAK